MAILTDIHDQRAWKRAASWFAHYELVWLTIAAPFLLFPNRWTPLAAVLIALAWPARRLATTVWTRYSPLNIPAFLILAMAFTGVLVSMDYAVTEAKWWGIFLQTAILFALLNSLRAEQAVQKMAALLIVIGLAVVVLSLIGTDWDNERLLPAAQLYDYLPQMALGLPNSGAGAPQTFFNPRQIGHTLGMLLPLAVTLFLFGSSWWLRLPAALLTLTGSLLLLLTGAAMGLFGFLAGLCLVAVWWRRWLLIPLTAAALALFGFLWLSSGERLLTMALDLENTLGLGVVLRLDIWSRALAMIGDMPFSGIGLNTFPLVQSHFYTGYAIGPEPHAHQLWLQTALDLGLPGLIAFLWLLANFTIMVIDANRLSGSREMQVLLVGLSAGVLAYVAAGTLDLSTLGSKPVAAFWAMFGLAAAVWANGRETSLSGSPYWLKSSTQRMAALLFLVLLAASLLLFPAARTRNLGLVRAHKILYRARLSGSITAEQTDATITLLNEALDKNPSHAQLLGTRGSLYAWTGETDKAIHDLALRMESDVNNPLQQYAPFISWRETLSAAEQRSPADNLIRVYSQWLQRYPDRAESYVLLALVWRELKDDSGQASGLLEQGIDHEAKPAELLEAYSHQLQNTK